MARRPKTERAVSDDTLLAELNETLDRACLDAFRGVLHHWAPRLAKHGLPGSAAAAKELAGLLGDTPPARAHDRDWWLRHAEEMGDGVGRELAIAHVRDALIGLLEDQEKSIRAARPTRRR